jgi:hypothetical protein
MSHIDRCIAEVRAARRDENDHIVMGGRIFKSDKEFMRFVTGVNPDYRQMSERERAEESGYEVEEGF